jgi:hypothetical protein
MSHGIAPGWPQSPALTHRCDECKRWPIEKFRLGEKRLTLHEQGWTRDEDRPRVYHNGSWIIPWLCKNCSRNLVERVAYAEEGK